MEELQLASALLVVSAKAVMRLTRRANCEIANTTSTGEIRDLNELILDRWGIRTWQKLAPLKRPQTIIAAAEVTYHQAWPWSAAVPQVERFVSPRRRARAKRSRSILKRRRRGHTIVPVRSGVPTHAAKLKGQAKQKTFPATNRGVQSVLASGSMAARLPDSSAPFAVQRPHQ